MREREEAMRDDLTVLVQRIHPKADDFEIFEFFSQAGKVRDIRLIRDQRSGKSKGVGYVEYGDVESVMRALALNGIAFKGQPLLVQASMAEKNRLAQAAKNVAAASAMMGGGEPAAPEEPRKLMVSDLHPHIAADDLKEVFSPFGELTSVEMQPNAGGAEGALGTAYITFQRPSDARDAQAAIHGLELAGRNITVSFMAELPAALSAIAAGGMGSALSGVLGGVPGLGLGAHLMMGGGGAGVEDNIGAERAALLARIGSAAPSPYVLLKNMFDPAGKDETSDPDFFGDLREDIMEECGKFGKVEAAKVDRASQGHVLLQFDSTGSATKAASSMHSRWFAGKQITAEFTDEAAFASAPSA